MHDVQGVALIVLLGLGLVSGILRLNRGVPTPRQRVLRQVVTILMIAAAVVWLGRHPFR
jgi:hypothetical protein